MVGLTLNGIVTKKQGNNLVIILDNGRKISSKLTKNNKITLGIGDKCHVIIDESEDKATGVLAHKEKSFNSTFIKRLEPVPTSDELKSCDEHIIIEDIDGE